MPNYFRTWFDEDDLLIGSAFPQAIQRAIQEDVDYVIIFFGKDAIESDWVRKELEWALEREKQINRTFILPILLEDVWDQIEPKEFRERLYLQCIDQSEVQIKNLADRLQEQVVKRLCRDHEENIELRKNLSALLGSLSDLVRSMNSDEKRLLRVISEQPRKGLEITDSFERNSRYHETLRLLRDRNLVQPAERGAWRSGKHAQMTEIGKALLRSGFFQGEMFEDGMPTWWISDFQAKNFLADKG